MPHQPAPSPAQRGRAGEGGRHRITRRRTLAAAFAFLAAAIAARPSHAATAEALRRALPPGLDPHALGAALRAAHPACTGEDCRARAALPDLSDLPNRARADFAAGDTVTVDGWILSRTEAWLCAALA